MEAYRKAYQILKGGVEQIYPLRGMAPVSYTHLLLGLVVFFVLTAHNLSVYVRENISFSILISDDMKEADILKLQKKLNQEPFVKQSEYISKKQALKEQTEAMGTDPEEFLGYNPFTASLEIKLHSDYANSDSIAKIEKMVKRNRNIQDVL